MTLSSAYLVDGTLQTDQGLVELSPWLMELVLMLENTKDSDEPLVKASRKLIYEAGWVLKHAVPYTVPPEYTTYDDEPAKPPIPAKPTLGRKVRAWAKEQGYQLQNRGRIPKEVLDAYQEAHPDDKSTV